MSDTMVDRGPDSHGSFSDRSIAVGMRRLSIAGDDQPIGNETGTIHIV